jgi:transposase-like protein
MSTSSPVPDDAEPDVVAYMSFPLSTAKLHSTKPIERLEGEIQRGTGVVGISPNEDAVVRVSGALLFEQNKEWRFSAPATWRWKRSRH